MERLIEWWVVNFLLGLMSVLLMVFTVALTLLVYCDEEALFKVLWLLRV